MNILLINYEYPPIGGGGGVLTETLAEELSKKNKVFVLTSSMNNPGEEKPRKNLVICRCPALFRNSSSSATLISLITFPISAFLTGAKVIKKNNIDVIHSFFVLPSGLLGFILSKMSGIPHIVTVIGGDIYDPSKSLTPSNNWLLRTITERLLRSAGHVTAISEDIKARVNKLYEGKFNVTVVPIGILFPLITGKYYPKRITRSSFEIVTVARFVPRKNLDNLLYAFSKLKIPEKKLTMIGDGPEKKKLMSLAKKLEISQMVKFPGFVSEKEKYEYLKNSNCFVLCSSHEGFGIVYLEAMFFGLPIIASNEGGQRDFLENGKTGFLIKSSDRTALTTKMTALYEEKKLSLQLSRYNRFKVKSYSTKNMAANYQKIYDKFR